MTALHALAIIAIVQTIFLLCIVALLVVNRTRALARGIVRAGVTDTLSRPLHDWLVGKGPPEGVADVLASLPVNDALTQTIVIANARAAPTQREEFARTIRDARWTKEVLGRATARNWWRRMDAARLLAIVGTPAHHALLIQLLHDKHPAVQSMAASSLPVIADPDAVALVLKELPNQPLVVRLYQFSMLRDTWWITTPALLKLLDAKAPADQLETWISLGEAIGTPELLDVICALASHEEALVRVAVARALKRYFHPRAMDVLVAMLDDTDWRVRATAARSLGYLGAEHAVPRLAAAIGDSAWWVRFRSALALAQLGEAGRRALRDARASDDRFASEMATMVSGLSPGSVVELSES